MRSTNCNQVNLLPTFDPSFVTANNDWLQELVCFIFLVSLLDGGNRVIRCFALAFDQTLDSNLDPLPSLITIHGIVPADNGNEFSNVFLLDKIEEVLRIFGRGTRSSVTAIAEEVYVDVWNFEFLRCLKKREEVIDMGVDTTIRDLSVVESVLSS